MFSSSVFQTAILELKDIAENSDTICVCPEQPSCHSEAMKMCLSTSKIGLGDLSFKQAESSAIVYIKNMELKIEKEGIAKYVVLSDSRTNGVKWITTSTPRWLGKNGTVELCNWEIRYDFPKFWVDNRAVSLKLENHEHCPYCGSRCEDKRGNCGSCGAPNYKRLGAYN